MSNMSKQTFTTRRHLLTAIATFALLPLAAHAQLAQKPIPMEVWKTPTCGCCGDWIKHMEANGFKATVKDVESTAQVRRQNGIADKYESCHTALIGGYAIEGHIPAKDVKRLLKEKPDAAGLAAPGMPLGSPGMDGPMYNGRKTPHDVLLVKKDGTATVFESYR